MKETLVKLAAELRKLAAQKDKEAMQKCAKITLGAAALALLHKKVKGA